MGGIVVKRTFLKAVSLVLIIIITTFSFVFTADSYETYYYNSFIDYENISLVRNESEIFLIGTSSKSVIIEGIYPDEFNITLSLSQKADRYFICSDILILISYMDDNNQTKVTLYDIYNDTFNSFVMNGDEEYMNASFAYSNGYVYIAKQNGDISYYTKVGKFCGEYNIDTKINSLITDFDDNVFALSDNGVYSIEKDYYTKTSNTGIYTHGCFIDYNVFVDYIGNFYTINRNNIQKSLSFSRETHYLSGGVCDNYFVTSSSNKIHAINRKNLDTEKYFSLNDDIYQLFSMDDMIVALTFNSNVPNITYIDFDEFKNINQPNKNNSNNNKPNNDVDDDISNDNYDSDSNNQDDYNINSDVYDVDFENMKISGIYSPTTVGQFKRNMNYEGFEVELYRYSKDTLLKSGNVGTATRAVFYNNNSSYTFELSVVGDITGEGNVNSRDKKHMFSYLLKRFDMTGVFIDSADLDNNSTVDIIDLILLLRAIKK